MAGPRRGGRSRGGFAGAGARSKTIEAPIFGRFRDGDDRLEEKFKDLRDRRLDFAADSYGKLGGALIGPRPDGRSSAPP